MCGACGHGVVLTTDESRPALGPVPADEAEADPARARQETAALFEHDEARELWWLDAVVGPLTLGVVPMVRAERALQQHAEDDLRDLPEHPPEGLDAALAARWQAVRRGTVVSPLRRLLPLLMIMVSLVAVAAIFVSWWNVPLVNLGWTGGPYARPYGATQSHLAGAFLALYGVLLACYGHLHALRASVRAHERRQLYLRLVGDAVPKASAEALLVETNRAWNQRRVQDGLLTLFGLVPFYGLIFLPITFLRLGGALGLHQNHEEKLRQVTAAQRARSRKD